MQAGPAELSLHPHLLPSDLILVSRPYIALYNGPQTFTYIFPHSFMKALLSHKYKGYKLHCGDMLFMI